MCSYPLIFASDDDVQLPAKIPVPGAARMAGFERLRGQFARRKRDQANWLSKNIAEVDIEEFTHDPPAPQGPQGSRDRKAISFELCGALPPTVSHKEQDVAIWKAIGHAERQAAKDIIEKQKAEDKARIDASVQSVRWPRSIADKSCDVFCQGASDRARTPCSPFDDSQVSGQVSDELESMVDSVAGMSRSQNLQGVSSLDFEVPASMSCAPGARNWESNITDFYRRWEAHNDEEHADEARVKKEEMYNRQCEKVREKHFHRKHDQRALAIVETARRVETNFEHREEKLNREFEVQRQRSERQEYQTRLIQDERIRARRGLRSRENREVANAFVAQRMSLDKTCKKIDLWKGRLQDKAEAARKVEGEKEVRDALSRRAAAKRTLQEAQKRKVDGQQERKQRYLVKLAGDQVRNDAKAVRDRVAEMRTIDRSVRTQREELLAVTSESNQGQQDVDSYERTLAALRDLAQGVRIHGQVAEEPWAWEEGSKTTTPSPRHLVPEPLPDTEPRVRAALAGGALGTSSPVMLFSDSDDAAVEAHVKETPIPDDVTPWPAPCALMMSARDSRASARDTCTPRTSRSARGLAPSPLHVRPLVDLRHQVSRPHTSPAVPKKGESLSALRAIRRTGNIVRR